MPSAIVAKSVAFELSSGRKLFQNLNFSLDRRLTALVGANGIGKTTLAKLLAGEGAPTEGTIRRHVSVVYFPQAETAPTMRTRDYLSSGSWSEARAVLLAGIRGETLCSRLSGGEWMRVRLAKYLGEAYLILDEPTNNLDRSGREALKFFLREHRFGALLISHDRECLKLCDEVLELSRQGITRVGGGWNAYLEMRDAERDRLLGALDGAKRELATAAAHRRAEAVKQEKRNRRGLERARRGGIPKILLGKRKRRAEVTTAKKAVESLERVGDSIRDLQRALADMKVDPVMFADLVGYPVPNQKLIAEVSDFNVRFDHWLYETDLTFSWRGNLRLGLRGKNGAGKSTLVRAILGETFETRGKFRRGELKTLYLDQSCSLLDDEKSVYENIRETANLTETEIRNGLAKFLFAKETVFQKVKDLSGGEKLRAALAKGFLSCQKPELLILDEPTNNLDHENTVFLEKLIREFKGAVILISHDEIFLEKCGMETYFSISGNTPCS